MSYSRVYLLNIYKGEIAESYCCERHNDMALKTGVLHKLPHKDEYILLWDGIIVLDNNFKQIYKDRQFKNDPFKDVQIVDDNVAMLTFERDNKIAFYNYVKKDVVKALNINASGMIWHALYNKEINTIYYCSMFYEKSPCVIAALNLKNNVEQILYSRADTRSCLAIKTRDNYIFYLREGVSKDVLCIIGKDNKVTETEVAESTIWWKGHQWSEQEQCFLALKIKPKDELVKIYLNGTVKYENIQIYNSKSCAEEYINCEQYIQKNGFTKKVFELYDDYDEILRGGAYWAHKRLEETAKKTHKDLREYFYDLFQKPLELTVEHILYSVDWLNAEIGNGGLFQYVYNDSGKIERALLLEVLKVVGAKKTADVIIKTFDLNIKEFDDDEVGDYTKNLEANEGAVASLEEELAQEDYVAKVINFIRAKL